MRTIELDKVVRTYGIDIKTLEQQIETVFGSPSLVTLTGSVIAGFGNKRSDIDVMVVVDTGDKITQLPIMSYVGSARVDVEYYSLHDIEQFKKMLEIDLMNCDHFKSPQIWREYLNALRTHTRLAISSPIQFQPGWDAWLDEVNDEVLKDRTARWWEIEAYRLTVAARWLTASNPRLSAVKFGDAIYSVLSAKTAREGQLFMSKKWLGQKLAHTNDNEGLRLFHQTLEFPSGEQKIKKYCQAADIELSSFLQKNDMLKQFQVQLRFAKGVEVHRLRNEILVTRWGMRGITVPNFQFSEDLTIPIWTGSPNSLPEGALQMLFLNDMLWLSFVPQEIQ